MRRTRKGIACAVEKVARLNRTRKSRMLHVACCMLHAARCVLRSVCCVLQVACRTNDRLHLWKYDRASSISASSRTAPAPALWPKSVTDEALPPNDPAPRPLLASPWGACAYEIVRCVPMLWWTQRKAAIISVKPRLPTLLSDSSASSSSAKKPNGPSLPHEGSLARPEKSA